MGLRTRTLLAALAAVTLGGLGLAVPASAGLLPEPDPQLKRAKLVTTGNHSERFEKVPIAREPFTRERVAMSLGPPRLPQLDPGDRLQISAEVQVSTTCVHKGPRCIGRRYDYNPWVTARLALASGTRADDPSVPLGEPKQIKCTQRRPQRNHHCTIAFENFDYWVGDPASLPCATPDQCHVNLIVGAWKKRAKAKNVIVLGADRPDASVVGDKGRLNVIEVDQYTEAPTTPFAGELANLSLPLNEGKKVKRRVVHWVEIPNPRRGEVIAFNGSYIATIDRLPFNTYISSRVLITEAPLATAPDPAIKPAVQFRGQATESNGFNCTQGRSGFSTPCTAVKAGAVRIKKHVNQPLYVNLIAAAKPLLYPQQKLKAWQRVKLEPAGGLQVWRFAG